MMIVAIALMRVCLAMSTCRICQSLTYLALQLEIRVDVFPEAREYEESRTSTVANLFARRADRGLSKSTCARPPSHEDEREISL